MSSETYEDVLYELKDKFSDCVSDLTERVCPFCKDSVAPFLVVPHVKKCMWWFSGLYHYGHSPYTPPAKQTTEK